MNTRPKILMLTTQLGFGGAQTSFIRLANFLSETMEVTVALFTLEGTYSQGQESLNAEVVLLDGAVRGWRLRRWWRRISMARKLKAQHDVSISFLSGPNVVNVLAGHNAGTIISLRGSRIYDPVISPISRRVFQYLFDPICFYLAASIVAVSPGLKNEIRQVVGKKMLEKVSIISPFVEPEILAAKRAMPPPEPYGQLKGQKVIVSVGRLSVEKGFHYLIPIFAEVAKTQLGIKLLLVGDGPMMQSLRVLCTKNGLRMDDFSPGATSVIFAGYQKNTLPLIALGNVYAMTSATEGLPNVVLEAMAAGVPVVAADTPWGVRAILSAQAEGQDPYPTQQASPVEYGVLMPRIDRPEYKQEWVRTLSACLDKEAGYAEKGRQRLQDYHLATVGPQWVELIRKIGAHEISE